MLTACQFRLERIRLFEVRRASGFLSMALASNDIDAPDNEDFADHLETYQTFVRWLFIFAAHVAVILTLLAYFFG